MESLERIISEHPFFAGLDKAYLELISGCAANVRFDAGQYLFKEGEEASQFFLLRSGRVALEIHAPQRRPIMVSASEEGDVIGWSWLLPPYIWKFHARATETTRAFALDGKCLRGKCEANHDLGYELLKRFAHLIEERLEHTRMQLLDLYTVDK